MEVPTQPDVPRMGRMVDLGRTDDLRWLLRWHDAPRMGRLVDQACSKRTCPVVARPDGGQSSSPA